MLTEKTKNTNAIRLRIGSIVAFLGLWRLIYRGHTGYILLISGVLVALWGYIGLKKEKQRTMKIDQSINKES